MWQYILKVLVSAITIVAISALAKRSSLWAAVLASLPLTSLLAFIWLYLDTGDLQKISALSNSIFWLILPSTVLFISLPALVRIGLNFWLSLLLACIFTAASYFVMIKLLNLLNIQV